MILSFKDRETQTIWNQEKSRKLPVNIQQVALRKLYILNRSKNLNDLMIPPGNKLEKLGGNREEQYSIRVNDQWRICFFWLDGNASEVEIVDYH